MHTQSLPSGCCYLLFSFDTTEFPDTSFPRSFEEAVTRALFFKSTPTLRPVCCVSGFCIVMSKIARWLMPNVCFRSRWGDLWWRTQGELWLQHRFVIFFFFFFLIPSFHKDSVIVPVCSPPPGLFQFCFPHQSFSLYFKMILCDCSQLLICIYIIIKAIAKR